MFVIDTHAGPGRYDLESTESIRGHEAELGIKKVLFDLKNLEKRARC